MQPIIFVTMENPLALQIWRRRTFFQISVVHLSREEDTLYQWLLKISLIWRFVIMADDGDVDGDDKEKSVHEDIVSLLLDYLLRTSSRFLIFQTVK